ncbi:MAG: M14 family zinc carboxypeptidase, partial [Candidatus Fermentibacteria bacterium]
MYNSFKVLLVISMIAISGDSMLMHDFSYSIPRYSVTLSGIGPGDISILEEKGFLIEWAGRGTAILYVDADMEQMLWRLGYNPVPVPVTVPLEPYPTLQEIYDAMDSVVAAHPDICRKVTIGSSIMGREIEAVVVSDNPFVEEIEPELRIHGGIHGDEPASCTTTLHFLQVLTDNCATSPMCEYLVNNAETWVIPVLNPDGYYYVQRTNANGVDLNRNFSYKGPGGGGGAYAFSEPETSALRDLTMQNWPEVENFINPFTAGLSMHGGWTFISSPWNYDATAVLQDTLLMLEQGYQYADSDGILAYFGVDFDVFVPGGIVFEANGDVNDWSYGECGTVDYTLEVHEDFFVSDWPGVANAHYMAIVEFFTGCTYGIWGTVTDLSGNPIDANLEIGLYE